MIASLKEEITRQGDRAAIVPAHRLAAIRQDVEALKTAGGLNDFQQDILNNIYRLDAPQLDFEIRSILIVASPSPASLTLLFTQAGKQIPVLLPASYVDKEKAPVRIERYLQAFLHPRGFHVRHAPRLPHKLLAVRSGLGAYGRNNICFVEGMGSFLNLSPYFSDIPCSEDAWQEIHSMERCRTCQACLQACPTAAILPARFLIDNERCLTFFNEAGGEWNFPAWIDPAAHHTLYGCLRCQMACPANQPYLNTRLEPVAFSEQETACLWEGRPFEEFPAALQQKVEALNMKDYLSGIPRNLRPIFTRAA